MNASTTRSCILQERIYTFILTYQQNTGRPPTYREIGKAVGITSTSHIHYHLVLLEQQGLIVLHADMKRGIEVRQKLKGIPILGRIAAGEPLEILARTDEFLDVTDTVQPSRGVYALQVVGSSMKDELIYDGDYVLVQPQKTCENGDVIIAVHVLDDERASATLKRCYKERSQHRVRLQPANAEMEPLFIPEREWKEEWEIQGKVVAVHRPYQNAASI
jgi:repressor LexA